MGPTPGITITLARPSADELAALEAIELAAFPSGSAGMSLREETERPWARFWLAREEDASAPSGFLLAWDVADELHVLTVATSVGARRRGIGRALVQAAVASARERRARLVLLEVRRSNAAAIGLYRSAGFAATGIRERYYADTDEDAIEMILVLDPATGEIVPGRDEVRLEEA
jgi:ribosomal-protein-alanine N-acetyltransferase